jgi:hypothetical protein
MRLLAFTAAVFALALPAASPGARGGAGDGQLLIKHGDGFVALRVKGAVIGHFASGVMDVNDPDPTDGDGCDVVGSDATRFVNDTKTRYMGKTIAFRCVGGLYVIRFMRVRDLSLAAVGHGTVIVSGAGGDDGTVSVDGSDPRSLPEFPTPYTFGING